MIRVTSSTSPEPGLHFPSLLISEQTACLILACGVNPALPNALVGVCLHPGASGGNPGDIRDDWDKGLFVPYESEITISNE